MRELANAIEAAVIRAHGEGAEQIEGGHVFEQAHGGPPGAEAVTFQAATRRFQAEFLRAALEKNGWNVQDTARKLDLARSHVYNLIRGFGLERKRS